jgi:hypothetical protein
MRRSQDAAAAFLARLLTLEFGAPDGTPGLAAFQQTGVTAVERALDQYGGVVLADEVGLGKTHLAAAVAERVGPVVVVAPAHLTGMWATMCPNATLLTHASLSRDAPSAPGARLVIVDEAQRFTNPASARYRALAAGFGEAAFVLVTATPLGMSRSDIVALLRLFLPRGALAPVLGETLERWVQDPDADWTLLTRTVLVRRSRAVLDAVFPAGIEVGPGCAPLHFPQTQRRTIPWRPDPSCVAAVCRLAEHLDTGPLQLPTGLARTLLLSRLESSHAAVDGTLGRFAGFLTRRLEARRGGGDLDRTGWRRFFGGLSADLDRQTVLPFLFDAPRNATVPETAVIQTCLDHVSSCRRHIAAAPDRKPDALADCLDPRRTLVFTRSAETATALFETLRRRHPDVGLGLIRGDAARIGGSAPDATVDPSEVLARFGPDFHTAGQVLWLVATDVLSEGANLQQATRVVSYDIPWNPLRLVQRHGRVDRLGAAHREVEVLTLTPEGPLETELGLVTRVARRAAEVEAALGDSGALAGVLTEAMATPATTTVDVQSRFDRSAIAELQLRIRHLRLGPAPTNAPVGIAVTGNSAALFVFHLGIQGAPHYWCLVTPDQVRAHRREAAQLLLALDGATPRRTAPPGPLRRAMTAATHCRRALREVAARPIPHPTRAAAGRLLRILAARRPPRRSEPEFAPWVLLHATLKRPLSSSAARRLAAALDAGTTDLTTLALSAGRPAPCTAQGEVRLLAFVVWSPPDAGPPIHSTPR